MKLSRNFFEYADMIKLGHTLFALPYALAGFLLAIFSGYEFSIFKLFWIILAFVGARSSAMGFNRIVDAKFDAENPRTKNRSIPAGRISKNSALIFVIFSVALMLLSARMLNELCFWLSFPAIAVLFGYSYCKRFTNLCHIVLGLALSLAPAGAWCAVSDKFSISIIFLSFALLFQISAFDILYALQDESFDKLKKLHSIPATFGKQKSIAISSVMLLVSIVFLFLTGTVFNLGGFFYTIASVILILYTLSILIFIKSGIKKIDLIFFYINASCSFLTLASITLGGLLK